MLVPMIVLVAMLVVVFMRFMVMCVVVLVRMVMRVIMGMIVTVGHNMASTCIGSAFGVKRRFNLHNLRTKTAHHVFNDMIPADAQALAHDLRWQMAVAEVPRHAHHMLHVARTDFRQRLRRGQHFNTPSIIQHQRVARAQQQCVRQIEHEGQPAHALHGNASAMPVIVVEHDSVSRLAGPVTGGLDFCGAQSRQITSPRLYHR